MAALYEGIVPTAVQLSLIVPFACLVLFRKFLVAKLKDLVSQNLHVGDHRIISNCSPPNFHDRSSFAIATQSNILKITLPCPHADTSGRMGKATPQNS
jgi:hypothetical protein